MLKKRIKAARARGVPLIALETADQAAAVRLVVESINGDGQAVVAWDVVRGPHVARDGNVLADDPSEAAVNAMCDGADPAMLVDLPTCLDAARERLPDGAVLVLHNVQRFLGASGVPGATAIQAVANLRDPFGATGRTCVMLCPAWSPPAELGSDVHVLDDPCPDGDARGEITRKVIADSGVAVPDDDVGAAVSRTRGLSRFVVEQTVALSLSPSGLDRDELLSRFVAAVNATPGLTYKPPTITLDDVGGLENVKEFLRSLAGAAVRFDAVVFVDEIEKMIGGTRGDLSGVSQDIFGQMLTYMQESEATGLIALGPPGAGKSMSAVAAGAALGIPTIGFDVGAMKGSLVGQSEQQARAAFRTLRALAPSTLWIATCNSDTSLPPELMRRFGFGTWYFDLLSPEERAIVWKLKGKKYGVDVSPKNLPEDDGWTGAEIESCCRTAASLGITPKQAAAWIVPVAVRAAETIDALRRLAHNRYVSASAPGPYQYTPVARKASTETRRKFDFEDRSGGKGQN